MRRTSSTGLAVLLAGVLALPLACSGRGSGSPAASSGGADTDSGPADTDASASGDGGGTADTDARGDAAAPPECTKPADCASKVCTAAGRCAAPSATDAVQNGDETDVDCGGSAPQCEALKRCTVAGDCVSAVCSDLGQGLRCQPPSPTDGVKNGTETDIDCGGAKAPACADGKSCGGRGDCASDVCTAGKCIAPVCPDGAKNGLETAIDCGGPACPRCGDNLSCLVPIDCASGVCQNKGAGLTCQPPSPTDGVMNGAETDTDCGGAGAPKCGAGKSCKIHADCSSDGCGYDNKCAIRKSCTGHYGGDTCGTGGAGGQGLANWESCCATAPAGAGGVAMDKYQVTSGRMRAFLERVNGNVRGAIQALRAAGKVPQIPADAAHSVLDPNWDLYLPTSMIGCDQDGTCGPAELTDHFYGDTVNFQGIYTSAYRHVGGSIWSGQNLGAQGCSISSPGTHTYWMDRKTQLDYFGDVEADFDQTVYDTKSLNCVEYLMAQAFCVWDGGRLETFAEWQAAIGPGAYPWGAGPAPTGVGSASYFANRFPGSANVALQYANYYYSYEYPHQGPRNDYVVFIAAPGRLGLLGHGPWGHADLAYNVMEMTSSVTWNASPKSASAQWSSNGSWEGHGYSKSPQWAFSLMNKYGKQGLRCVYP